MTILMLAGAFCFSVFIIFCMDNMQIFNVGKEKKLIYAVGGIIIAATAIIARAVAGLSGQATVILCLFLMIILWFVIYKNPPKVAMLTVYIAAIYFGVEGMYTLSCTLIGREPAPPFEYAAHTDIKIAAICWCAVILATIFLKKPLKKRIDMNILNNRAMYFMVISACISLFFIYLNFTISDTLFTIGQQKINFSDIAYLLFFVSSIVMFVITLRYISKETAMRTEKLLIESSKKYIRDLEESYNALRTIKHDYVNILTSLKLHIDAGDMENLEKYYYGELTEINRDLLCQDRLMSSLQNVQVSEIKSVLIYKTSAAAGQEIDTCIEVSEPVEKLGVSTAIVCQVLGILLDNAIEAAAEIETGKKCLNIAIINNPNSKTFIIKNTWQSREFPISKLFELGFSTKGEGRGIGLYTVRNLTEKIKGLYLETDVSDEFFTQIFTVKND
ncbi:MAG: GHKL domain-containing protein [Oscillospiraceae bacterium]|nr:GHKL domain-containing protein [Oscillospiraceae bacterium]